MEYTVRQGLYKGFCKGRGVPETPANLGSREVSFLRLGLKMPYVRPLGWLQTRLQLVRRPTGRGESKWSKAADRVQAGCG